MLNEIKRISQICSMEEITPLSKAVFPGTHCPLFGSALVLKNFKDCAMVILGTEECTYYSKVMAMSNEAFYNRCFSVVTDQHDITFGSRKKLEAAIGELMEAESPEAIFIVTTCVIELIGDDIDSVAETLSSQYNVPIMVVHTEHFRCDSHVSGMTGVLEQTIKLMEDLPKERCVNILGHRHNHFEESELYHILHKEHIAINLNLPAVCTTEEIKQATKASLNIVCDEIGEPLARQMKEHFGIDYVLLNKSCNLEYIHEVYKKIFEVFDLEVPIYITELKQNAMQRLATYKACLKGLTYIYGNTPVPTFECIEFLYEMGMTPELIQTKVFDETDLRKMERLISEGVDPYITKAANIAPLQHLYDVLKPTFYLGHENPINLRKKGIIQLALDSAGEKCGFELPVYIAEMMTKRYAMSKER